MQDHQTHATGDQHSKATGKTHYRHLGMMTALSFIAMYVLMYAMVNAFDNVYMNFNQVYMAGLMAAPMVLIELIVMRGMYRDKRLNAPMAGGTVLAGVVCYLAIRQQAAIGDRKSCGR